MKGSIPNYESTENLVTALNGGLEVTEAARKAAEALGTEYAEQGEDAAQRVHAMVCTDRQDEATVRATEERFASVDQGHKQEFVSESINAEEQAVAVIETADRGAEIAGGNAQILEGIGGEDHRNEAQEAISSQREKEGALIEIGQEGTTEQRMIQEDRQGIGSRLDNAHNAGK